MYFDMLKKLSKVRAGSTEIVWVDPLGYQAAVAERKAAFVAELARQQQGSGGDESKEQIAAPISDEEKNI
jgi:hypothetical protein